MILLKILATVGIIAIISVYLVSVNKAPEIEPRNKIGLLFEWVKFGLIIYLIWFWALAMII